MKDARKVIILLLNQLVNGSSVDILSDIHKYIWADKIIIYIWQEFLSTEFEQ